MKHKTRDGRVGLASEKKKNEQLRNLEIKFVGVSGWAKLREERKTGGRSVTVNSEKKKTKKNIELDERAT